MQNLYVKTRRIVAILLAVALVVFAVLALVSGRSTGALVSAIVAAIAVLLLVFAIVPSTVRVKRDATAYFLAASAIAVAWGASPLSGAVLTYLPALVVAVGYATVAVTLGAKESAAHTRDRL